MNKSMFEESKSKKIISKQLRDLEAEVKSMRSQRSKQIQSALNGNLSPVYLLLGIRRAKLNVQQGCKLNSTNLAKLDEQNEEK